MEPIARAPVGRLALPALRDMVDSIPEIDHYELDGIPLFHLPAGGATVLTLAFGVGRAHEPVHQGGMTHLAEHLILTAIDGALDHSNGTTEPYRVTFTVRGSPADATKFLRDVCEQIKRPRLSRMHEEANVLHSEAALRPSGMSVEGRLNFLRAGYEGIGKVELPEFFLRRMEARILEDWIKRYFVARNAALWVMGPLPDDLFVSLEPGSRTPASPFRTISGFEGPAMLQEDIGAVGASFLVDRGLAVQVAMRTVEQHLRRALRVDRGLGYAVGADYRPVSKEQAIAWVYASCLPEKVAEVQRFMLETIDDVAARGASEDEIATFFEQYLRDGTDPMAFPMRLDRRVQDELMGVEAKPLAEQIDAMWRIQPGEVAEAFRAARDTMLLLLPINAVPPNRAFKPYPGAMPGPIGDGQTFDYLAEKGSKYKGRMPKLFVGSRGLYLDTPAGRVVTILWPDCVAVVKDEHVRSVLSRDGSSIVIGPERWRNGYNAVALVDRYSPSSVVVP